MTTNLVLLLSLAYFKRKKREMVFLHARLLEHLMFQFAPCLLCMKQLWQAEVRTYQKVVFTCPACAFNCSGSRSGPPSPICLHPCKCGSPLNFPVRISSAALGSSQLVGQELQLLPPSPSAEQPLSYRMRAAAPWPGLTAGRAVQQRGVGGALVQGKGCRGHRYHIREAGGKAQWLERAGMISVLPCKALLNTFLGMWGDDETGHQLHACCGMPGKAKRWQSVSQWRVTLRLALPAGLAEDRSRRQQDVLSKQELQCRAPARGGT